MNYERIYKKFQSYEYISFDIFDTLIKRDVVNPKDIFFLVEKKLENMNINIHNYRIKRLAAESETRKNLNKEEISLSNIYDSFYKNNQEYDKETILKLREIEIETEIEVSTINLNIKPIFDYCILHNKKIVLISDMYLEKDIIEKILIKNNIDIKRDYFELFISNEFGCTKRSGKLYEAVKRHLGIKNNDIYHIGDSLRSDYLMAIKNGIKAYHIDTNVNNTNYTYLKTKDKNIKYYQSWLDKFISNRILNMDNDYEKFGYECIGPLLYDFCIWLDNNFKKNNFKCLNFLSREGQILQKAFNIIFPDQRTNYLCVSRKSIIGAMLCRANSIEDRLNMIQVPHAFDRKVVIDLLGLDVKKYSTYINFDEEKIYKSIEDVINDNEFFEFLGMVDCQVVKNSEGQKKILEKYLKFDQDMSDICIVDIGWNGTMQYYLNKLLELTNNSKKIQGYYMGVSMNSIKKYPGLNNCGYLFEKELNDIKIDENMVFSFCGLFESIFTADHGSVKEYYKNNNDIKPIFYNYEYEHNYKVISQIQKGALNFVEDYQNSIIKNFINLNCKIVSSKILRFGNYPRKNELKLFKDLDFFDVKKGKMIGEMKLFRNSFKELHNEFVISGWKVGFIKRVLYIFPASKFYCRYRKLINREKRNEQGITS
ncbi:MAG: HAD-IA family hydrolase [Clostridium butyricum]